MPSDAGDDIQLAGFGLAMAFLDGLGLRQIRRRS
jgi:hypothetical protein